MLKLPRRFQSEAHAEPHRTTLKQRSWASLLVLPAQVWSMHGQNQHHLGAREKCRCLGPLPQTCRVRLGILTESPGDSGVHPSLRKTNPFHGGPYKPGSLSESLAKLKTFLDLIGNSLSLNHHGWPRVWCFPPIFYLKVFRILT